MKFKDSKYFPLCVDLDGSLVATDTLLEAAILLIKRNPLYIIALLIWLIQGKQILKHKISSLVDLNYELLPYYEEVIEYIKKEKANGRNIVLTTASSEKIAKGIANYIGIFDDVISSDSERNLKGINKANVLIEKYGEFGFDYIGNSKADKTIWKKANKAIAVAASRRSSILSRHSSDAGNNYEVIEITGGNIFRLLLKEARIYQWVKNVLIFIPLLMAHKVTEPLLFLDALIAFLSFSFVASCVYIINDIFDLEADRKHQTKKLRPFASGDLSISYGLILASMLIIFGLFLSSTLLNNHFTYTLLIYIVLTSLYSIILKRIFIMDILVLASLYTLRLFAGAVVVEVLISPWFLAFSMFLFLSLAIVKRYNELNSLKLYNDTETNVRGYKVEDISLLRIIGTSSGYLSILIFILYINSNEVLKLYNNPLLLWAVVPLLLYWITRIWLLANRNEISEDPIVFMVRDIVSYIIGILIAAIVVGASL